MNKSYYLATAAVLAAAAVTVHAQLPTGGDPLPDLPPVVSAPNAVPPPVAPTPAPDAPVAPSAP
ncbi:MAG TPA: hypothetical protein VKE74_23865, partial [Gemmataceae bacterium]|nr:hypothetical protein [Gemmataceae bacterium]